MVWPPIQMGCDGERSHPINSLENKEDRGHTVTIEKSVQLHLYLEVEHNAQMTLYGKLHHIKKLK